MDAELRVLRAITRRLPPVRGAGRIANAARDFYARKPRGRLVVEVLGIPMELDPAENVDGSLLFSPGLYDRRELALLERRLRPGDVFVDVGAHLGLYALRAARAVAPEGRAIALEADPGNHERLLRNLALNPSLPVTAAAVAVSDEEGTARLRLNTTGNRGGNTLLGDGGEGIEVRSRPLAAILRDLGVGAVSAMKLDVEGMEFRVLRRFLEDTEETSWPALVILEHRPEWVARAGGNAVSLLLSRGYREVLRTPENRAMERP